MRRRGLKLQACTTDYRQVSWTGSTCQLATDATHTVTGLFSVCASEKVRQRCKAQHVVLADASNEADQECRTKSYRFGTSTLERGRSAGQRMHRRATGWQGLLQEALRA